MLAEINPLKGIYNDFVTILKGTEIKYSNKAAVTETLDSARESDKYIAAVRKTDTFASHLSYPESYLIKAGIKDPNLLKIYKADRRQIPIEYQETILNMMREKIISEYEEKNNYYRCLMGLPDIQDKDFIYVTDVDDDSIPKDIPIHLLNNSILTALWESGYINNLISKYPDKKYLKFMGPEAIDLMISRPAKNFAIIKAPDVTSVNEALLNQFKLMYDQCREYFMSVIYINEYSSIYESYDNFIALCIMVMTMQQVITRSITSPINREFFDDYCISLLFGMYNIPEIDDLTISDKKAISQNLNVLIQNKATDKVLYDIASILGFDSIKIYKYLIVKQQKFDSNGLPITKKKNSEDNKPTLADYRDMYDIYFQKVELKERDIYESVQDMRNREEYDDIVSEDPFWDEEDKELMDMLYDTEYNYAESKYLGITVSLKLSEVMFECVYFINMCLDKKTEISNVHIYLPKITASTPISIFDAVLAACVLLSKKNHLRGEILHSESKVLYVLGFDFNQNFDLIREKIKESKYLSNDMLVYLKNMTCYTAESVNNLYNNIHDIKEYMTRAMASATDIREYRAYEELYRAMFITEAQNKIYNMGTEDNPKYAETYEEYLMYKNPGLYSAIKPIFEMSDSTITSYISHILSKLNEIVPELKYLQYLNDATGGVINALVKLIKFFKSYTTDMIGLNIVYLFNTKSLNMLKLIDDINHIRKEVEYKDSLPLSHSDMISRIHVMLTTKDHCRLRDDIMYTTHLAIDEKTSLYLRDSITYTFVFYEYDYLKLSDEIIINKPIGLSDSIMFDDSVSITSRLMIKDKLSFADDLNSSDK